MVDLFGMFAVTPRQQLLASQILECDIFLVGQPVSRVERDLKSLGEQRPDIEPVPIGAKLGGNAKFGLALLEELTDLESIAAQEAEFHPVELPLDLVEIGNEQRQIDRMRQRNAKRANFAALQRSRQRARAACRLIALLQ